VQIQTLSAVEMHCCWQGLEGSWLCTASVGLAPTGEVSAQTLLAWSFRHISCTPEESGCGYTEVQCAPSTPKSCKSAGTQEAAGSVGPASARYAYLAGNPVVRQPHAGTPATLYQPVWVELGRVLHAPDAVDVVCGVALRCVHVCEVCLCAVEGVALWVRCAGGLLHSIHLQQERRSSMYLD
jgi:hypothetical protein